MTQLFKNNDDCRFFDDIISKAKQEVNGNQLVRMVNEITSSEVMGSILYDYALDWGDFDIDKKFFIENSAAILAAMQSAGCLPTYITLIKAMLGANTTVTFADINNQIVDPDDPTHTRMIPDKNGWLIVNIKEESTSEGQLGGEAMTAFGGLKGDLVRTAGIDKGVYFEKVKASHTVIEALKILNIIKPKGIYTEFRIVKD